MTSRQQISCVHALTGDKNQSLPEFIVGQAFGIESNFFSLTWVFNNI